MDAAGPPSKDRERAYEEVLRDLVDVCDEGPVQLAEITMEARNFLSANEVEYDLLDIMRGVNDAIAAVPEGARPERQSCSDGFLRWASARNQR